MSEKSHNIGLFILYGFLLTRNKISTHPSLDGIANCSQVSDFNKEFKERL